MDSLAPTVDYHPQLAQDIKLENNKQNSLPTQRFVPYPSASFVVPSENSAFSKVDNLKSNVTVSANARKQPYKSKRIFKAIIIGDAGVGKTCLSFRFCNGRFPVQTEATIGVDFRERSLVIDSELIRVQLWDTAGQERYRQSIVSHYYRNVNAVVFVYDVTNLSSFKSLNIWIKECQKYAVNFGQDMPHILIGNKCDLPSSSERVKTDLAQVFADENDMALFETSALADSESDHVESIFMTLVHKLRHSKAMHVQTTEERQEKGQRLLLKAEEAEKLLQSKGYCC